MTTTPDSFPGSRQEDELILEDRTADGDPTEEGAIRKIGDDVRIKLSTGVLSLLNGLWQQVGSYLEPITNGWGAKFYDSTGNAWAILLRTAGNFAISVGGTGANALYKNCLKEVTQLGGHDTSVYAHVQNDWDGACHTIYGDGDVKTYGNTRMTNSGSSTEYLDVGRDGTNGYISVAGGTQILKLTQKILECYLDGSTVSEIFRVVSAAGDAFKVFADKTAEFFGNVTCGGNVLPDANNSRDLGSSSLKWKDAYLYDKLTVSTGGFGSTTVEESLIKNQNAILNIDGGFGLLFKMSGIFSDAVYKFISGAAYDAVVRAYHGVGSGSTYTDLTHDGTDGVVEAGSGVLRLKAADDEVHIPAVSGDPASPLDGGAWYDSSRHVFRGRLENVPQDFSMVWPPAATNPSSAYLVDGMRYYNTSIQKWMVYDGTRSKWLSEESVTFQVGRNGDVTAGEYYRGVNGVQLSSTSGYPALLDGTVVGLSYTRSDSDSATFEVVEGGSAVAELASSATSGSSVSLDGDFSQGGVLAVRNKAGSNDVSYAQVWVTVRWRV